ncbi:MAG: hypothetical protein GX817_07340 [Elusimicrobia bacterium]|nr:hypothetical protein [Elusimicrobiota bacterium]
MRELVLSGIICVGIIVSSLQAAERPLHIVDVIDTPTASSVEFGSYDFSVRFYDGGSLLARLFYGIIMDNLTLGLSFDAGGFVGTGNVSMRRPYLYVKFPLYSGKGLIPAICLGFDEQGRGAYDEDSEKYKFAPMGFYLAMTSMGVLPGLNLGGGINSDYSQKPETLKGFLNLDFTLGPEFMLLGEVNSIGHNAYVNAGFRYLLTSDISFEISLRDIGSGSETERILMGSYRSRF